MSVYRLSLTFGALADSTRLAILARLAKGGASVTEIAKPFEMSLPAVSKHLKVLERAGLVTRGKEAQWRPAALEAGPPQKIDGWGGRYCVLWGAGVHPLGAYPEGMPKKGKGHGPQGKSRGNSGPRGRPRK